MPRTLFDRFCELVANSIDQTGIYPGPACWVDRKGKMTIAALALDAGGVLNEVWRQISSEQVSELVFGLDRFTKPGQGTEFADVLACAHWIEGYADSWDKSWRPFVINYQFEPRIVRPPDFANDFWNKKILSELRAHCPPYRTKLVTKE